jgi:hypothetical protein
MESQDDDGFVTIRDQVVEVPDDQAEAAEEAAGNRPHRPPVPPSDRGEWTGREVGA